ncbi:MAG: ATP-binding cassette domain-containing protein, partial [Neglectibacter timonensis]
KLPKGYDTLIGEGGVYLSGGEEQRVAVARAILKNAPILILDEATAYADPENEYQMQLALQELIKNKTVLIIAHRLITIKNANKIEVINGGKIEAEGTHDELLQARPILLCGMPIRFPLIGRFQRKRRWRRHEKDQCPLLYNRRKPEKADKACCLDCPC